VSSIALLATMLLGLARADGPDGHQVDQIRRALQLTAGVGSEYLEAFDDQGRLVRPIDIDETRLLLGEIRDLTAHLPVASDPALGNLLDGLTSLVDAQVPPDIVTSYAEVLRRFLIRSTGVREAIVPPERPSVARGAELFRENCTGCHGATGAGDGPDGARLDIKPADFTDSDFMRAETPRDAFNVITLGRIKAGMPAWGEAFSPQQVWDLIAFLWSIERTPATIAKGSAIWSAQCSGCHGTNGDASDAADHGAAPRARSLTGLLESADRSDADVFAVVGKGAGNGAMPPFHTRLDDDEIWAVVAYARVLSLEGSADVAAGAMIPDHGAELAGVGAMVDAAVDAYRRRDPAAGSLATNAYLRFEPLEKRLADRDEARMEALEAAFDTFRNALRDPKLGAPDALGRQLRADLYTASALLRSPATTSTTYVRTTFGGLAIVLAMYVLWTLARRLAAEHISS
jgi:high-affinity iron transporter